VLTQIAKFNFSIEINSADWQILQRLGATSGTNPHVGWAKPCVPIPLKPRWHWLVGTGDALCPPYNFLGEVADLESFMTTAEGNVGARCPGICGIAYSIAGQQ
jgi:hypothetical protein